MSAEPVTDKNIRCSPHVVSFTLLVVADLH
jgi:hypothetical protein